MADRDHVALLIQGPQAWNAWRANAGDIAIDLRSADLRSADLRSTDLSGADLRNADLRDADLRDADLSGADLWNADLIGAHLSAADLRNTSLIDALLSVADLSGAILFRANLKNAYLGGANLDGANLQGANLDSANLDGANLHGANLKGATLLGATLVGANLVRADLIRANLGGANLDGANLTSASVFETVFANLDLRETIGIESCNHLGPSTIDHRTLLRWFPPIGFLRGCGVPDTLIDYLPSLMVTPIQFFSCFISYATANQDFADRVYADLQAKGIRCWFAPHDMRPGRKVHEQIDEAIRVYDRLLLILSHESMASPWVKTEIARARRKELTMKRRVLFPLTLVPYTEIRAWEQFDADLGEDTAREIREFFVPDFSDWKNHDVYQPTFESVVKALKSPE